MKDKNSRKKPRRTGGTPWKIGEVRIISNPGPDAEDRQRRLLSLLVKYATEDGYFTAGGNAPADDRPGEDHDEAEA